MTRSSAAKPVDPACFSRACEPVVSPCLPAGTLLALPQKCAPRAFNAPTPPTGPFAGPFSLALQDPNSGQTSPSPEASKAGGVVNSEPFWERPAGTQTHSRRTGGKLGQVRHARQALVRVPESNTKYGGHRGKPRGLGTPWMGASISESSGIPKRKKIESEPSTGVTPRVHRPSIFRPLAIAFSGLRWT